MRPSNERWILLLIVAGLGQYVISGWVQDYGSNAQIVSYVSFAGTIVSIILAVLAIVYSYYQSFSQQRDSSNLAVQIDLLRNVVEEVRKSEEDLTVGLARFDEVGEKLDRSLSLGRATHTYVRQMQAGLERMSEAAGSLHQKATGSHETVALSPEQIDAFVGRALLDQLEIYYDYIRAADEGGNVLNIFEKYTAPRISSGEDEEDLSYQMGEVSVIGYILFDLGLLQIGDEFQIEAVSEPFRRSVTAHMLRRRQEGEDAVPLGAPEPPN